MKDFFKKHSKVVIWAIVMVIFDLLALIIPSNKLGQATEYYWGGFAFINLAFVLIGVVLFALQLNKTVIFNNTMIAYIFSAVYFVITFILNLIYMIIFDKNNGYKEVFIPNIIIVLLYVAAMIVAYRGMSHMSSVTKKTEEKVAQRRLTTAKVDFILNGAENEAVKKALFDLKEDVQYCDPIGVEATAELEKEFESKLDAVGALISGGAEEEEVLKAIKAAKNQLKYRNEVLKASK